MSENGKTIGDGVSRMADVLEHAGSGLSAVASVLVTKGEELIAALGEKASVAIGPAMGMVARLFDQYVEDQKEYIKSMKLLALKSLGVAVIALVVLSVSALLTTWGVQGIMSAETKDLGARYVPLVVFPGVVALISLGLAIGFTCEAVSSYCSAFERRAVVTRDAVSMLIQQSNELRKLTR